MRLSEDLMKFCLMVEGYNTDTRHNVLMDERGER